MAIRMITETFTTPVTHTHSITETHTDSEGNSHTSTRQETYEEMTTQTRTRTEEVLEPEPPTDRLLQEQALEEALAPLEEPSEMMLQAAAPGEGFVTQPDGSFRFLGTSGDDNYAVTQDTSGGLTVTNETSGATFSLTATEVAAGVDIWGGSGNDRITVDSSVRADLSFHGGLGNDTIDLREGRGDFTIRGGAGNDVITGGSGNDIIQGHSGNDVLRGGDGDDMIHGGIGNDVISGADGQDRLYGEEGDDRIFGGNDEDFVMGGDGADFMNAGAQSDVIYGDAEDTVYAGQATRTGDPANDVIDQIIGEDGMTVNGLDANDVVANYDEAEVNEWLRTHPSMVISGSAEFQERVRMDLGVMLSTAQGSGMLEDIADAAAAAGESVNIVEVAGSARYFTGTNTAESSNAVWNYSWDGILRTPTTALFHELAHGYQDLVGPWPAGQTQFTGGSPINNVELQATGLDWLDSAGNPGAAGTYSDNAFRRELGLPERTAYGSETGAPVSYVP